MATSQIHSYEFQHTAARRRLGAYRCTGRRRWGFQHTAARRRLEIKVSVIHWFACFNTQPPEGGWRSGWPCAYLVREFQHTAARRRLENNQKADQGLHMFQHTAARRRLDINQHCQYPQRYVSTHSRPKAAGHLYRQFPSHRLFQHTAARRRLVAGLFMMSPKLRVSTHSRPKAAGPNHMCIT